MKKWLSYREYSFLKRPLTLAEAEEVQAMTRRLASLCLLQPELDANYRKTKSATWQGKLLHNPQKSWHTASEGFPDSLSYTSLHINTTKARHPLTGCTYATPSSSRLPSKSSPHEGKPHVSGQTS